MFKNTKNIVLFSLFSFFTSTIAQLAPEKNATYTIKGEMSKRSWLRKLINANVETTTSFRERTALSLLNGLEFIFEIVVKSREEYDDATVDIMLKEQFNFNSETNNLNVLTTCIIQRTLKEYAIGFIFWGRAPYKESLAGTSLFNEISIIPAKCFAEDKINIRKSFSGYILKQYHYDEELVEGLAAILINIYGRPAVYLRAAHMLETQEATLKRRVISGNFSTNLESIILNMAMYYSECDSRYIRCQIGIASFIDKINYLGAIKISNSKYSGYIELEAIQNSPNSMISLLRIIIEYKLREWIELKLGTTIFLNAPTRPIDAKIEISLLL